MLVNTKIKFENIGVLFNFIEGINKSEISIEIPVLMQVNKNNIADLDKKLIENFDKVSVALVSQIGVQILFSDDEEYELYHSTNKNYSKKETEINIDNIIKFFKENNLETKDIDSIRVKITNYTTYFVPLRKILSYQFEDKGKMFTLDDGIWRYYNESFVNQLNNYIDSNMIITKPDILYSDLSEKLETLKDYRESNFNTYISENYDYQLLDRKLIPLNPNNKKAKIEIADLYKDKTLYHVKIGENTHYLEYTFDQAIISMKTLKNPEYCSVVKSVLPEIEKVNSINIWLVLKRSKNINHFSEIESIHFKMKLCEFYIQAKELGFTPKIFFEQIRKF